MKDFYILDEDRNVVEARSQEAWAAWMADHDRVVLKTHFVSPVAEVEVSTVFLGSCLPPQLGPLQVFETMVFGGKWDGQSIYQATWTAAELCHQALVGSMNAYYVGSSIEQVRVPFTPPTSLAHREIRAKLYGMFGLPLPMDPQSESQAPARV